MHPPNEHWGHTAHHVRDDRDRLVAYRMPAGGVSVEALLARPPFRRLAGRRATCAGRGHRASQSLEAISDRRELVLTAWRLRVTQGRSIREIAALVGRSRSLVGRWLRGIPAAGGVPPAWLAAMEADVARLVAGSERRRMPEDGVR